MYWIDNIKASYEEIEKPLEKDKVHVKYELIVNDQQQYALDNFLKQCKIQITTKELI